ncbi:MAG: lipase family protein [Candidatus Electrothrix sp. AR5]|nr:lipase family protein [Candidatus Electrothrix sp. AR5]
MLPTEFDHKATSFSKANLVYLAHCANIVYEPKEKLGQILSEMGFNLNKDRFFIEDKETDTQCFVAGDSEKIIVSFRGTETEESKDLKTDKKIIRTRWPSKDQPLGKVHRGFYHALKSVWSKVAKEIVSLRTNEQSVWFTGHSLGAALTTLAAATLYFYDKKQLVSGVYTFGQPRVGNSDFATLYNADLKEKTFRIVNNNDVVTRVPARPRFSHVGSLMYFTQEGQLCSDGDLSWWGKFWDKMEGRLDDFMELGTDGIKDHKMGTYQELCEKAYKVE